MANHHLFWVNQRFLCAMFNSYVTNYQKGNIYLNIGDVIMGDIFISSLENHRIIYISIMGIIMILNCPRMDPILWYFLGRSCIVSYHYQLWYYLLFWRGYTVILSYIWLWYIAIFFLHPISIYIYIDCITYGDIMLWMVAKSCTTLDGWNPINSWIKGENKIHLGKLS